MTCQASAKPTYHFSMAGLPNGTAAAQPAAAGGRRLAQSLRTADAALAAPGARWLLQNSTASPGAQATSSCNRIAYYQACGALLTLFHLPICLEHLGVGFKQACQHDASS